MARNPKMTSSERLEEVLVEDLQAQKLFSLVTKFLNSLGGVESATRRTQVSFKHGRAFAWIWLPQMWIKKQPRGSITLTFSLDHQVRDRRIKQSVEPYPGRYTHHVVITRDAEFDARVKNWLSEAHRLAGKPPNAHRQNRRS
jgi:molecular chaperone DnaK (HSP70)